MVTSKQRQEKESHRTITNKQHSIAEHNTAQHRTTHTAKPNPAQHSTAQHNFLGEHRRYHEITDHAHVPWHEPLNKCHSRSVLEVPHLVARRRACWCGTGRHQCCECSRALLCRSSRPHSGAQISPPPGAHESTLALSGDLFSPRAECAAAPSCQHSLCPPAADNSPAAQAGALQAWWPRRE